MNIPVLLKNRETVFAMVDDDASDWITKRTWKLKDGYAYTRVYAGKRNGKSFQRDVFLHRVIMGQDKGSGFVVDHINRIRLDNRKSNLRIITHQQNAQNKSCHVRMKPAERKSGFRGVHWDKCCGKWKAEVRTNGKNNSLGYFDNPIDADRVVRDWRKKNMPYAVEEGYAPPISTI